MWKRVRNFLLIIGGIFGFFFALSTLKKTGGGRVKKAIGKMEMAEEKMKKADAIDAEVKALQEKKGQIDRDTRAKIKEIRKMDDLKEISDAFNSL